MNSQSDSSWSDFSERLLEAMKEKKNQRMELMYELQSRFERWELNKDEKIDLLIWYAGSTIESSFLVDKINEINTVLVALSVLVFRLFLLLLIFIPCITYLLFSLLKGGA